MSRTVTTTDTQEKIPDTERLEKIYNFLADEDVHRNFGFWEHLDNIEEHLLGLFRKYFSPRAKSDKDEDGNFTYKDPDFEFVEWEKAMAMVKEHRKWMGKDYAPRKPFNTDSIAPLRQERYLLLTSEAIRPPTGQVIIAAPVSPTNPAIPKEVPLHLALPPEDPARKRLTDPLHYTKKAAQIRRLKEYASKNTEEKSIRHIAVHLPAPKNFHGPYVTPISNEQAPLAIAERVARVDSLIRALKEAQKKAPRRLLEKVIGRIEQGENVTEFGSKRLIDDFVEDWIQWTTIC